MKMSLNKVLFIIFSILLFATAVIDIEINKDFFLSSFVWNPVWRSMFFWVVVYVFWIKYIKSLDEGRKKKQSSSFWNIFLICLWLLAFYSIFKQDILWFDLTNYSFTSIIIKLIQNLQSQLIIYAISIGSLLFCINKEEIENIENENKKELLEEGKRKKAFWNRFPIINKIPVFGWVVKWFYKQGIFNGLLLLILTLAFLWFWLHHLWQFISVDEPKWLFNRVPKLYKAIWDFDWASTYINDKPWILPSLLAWIINLFLDIKEYVNNPLIIEKYLFWWRLPILLFNFLMLFIIYNLWRRLYSKSFWILLIGLIALNPILIWISQIVNPDATLWSTSFISFLSFFVYLKYNLRKYLYLSWLFFWLALISKFFVAIFYILFFIFIYLEYLFNITNKWQFFTRVLDLLKLFWVSILIYFLLFPINWVNHEQIIKWTIWAGILSSWTKYLTVFLFLIFFELIYLKWKFTNSFRNKINLWRLGLFFFSILIFILFSFLVYNSINNNIFFDFNDYVFWGKAERWKINIKDDIFASLYTTFYTLILPIIIILFLSLFFVLFKKDFKKIDLLLINSIFISYFVFICWAWLGWFIANTRYQIIMYPLLILYWAIVLNSITRIRWKTFYLPFFLYLFVIVFVNKPFYYHYTNILNQDSYLVTEAWWYGWYEVAKYINKLDNSVDFRIWSDREWFNKFFIWSNKYWRWADNPFEKRLNIDYLILTSWWERIFKKSLVEWNKWNKYLYSYVSANTPILGYYTKKPLYIKYIWNKNNRIKIVEIDKRDLIETNRL